MDSLGPISDYGGNTTNSGILIDDEEEKKKKEEGEEVVVMVGIYKWGDPTASYIWAGWVWDLIGLKSRL